MFEIKENIGFKIFYLALGLCLGAAFVFLPLKYAIICAFGLGFAVFSFFKPTVSYSMFFAGMLVIPNDYWNNMYIVLAALFYGGLYALGWIQGKNKGLNTKFLAPSLLVYILFCVISLFTGFGGGDSIRVFAILLGCIIHSVLITGYLDSKKDAEALIFMLACAVALTSLFGLYQYAMGIEIKAEFTDLTQSQGLARLFSTMGNPNNDAESWVMLAPLVVAMIVTTKNDAKRVILAGIVGLCVLALALTSSRSGYLALLAAAGIFILMVKPRLVPVGILVFIIMIPFLPQSIIDRVLTIGKDTSSKYRVYIWEGVFRMLEDFWVQGVGMGPIAFNAIYRSGYASTSASNAMHAHNVFLNAFIETGIGGVIALTAYIFKTFKAGITSFFNAKEKEMKFYSAAVTASLTGFLLFSFVEYVWFYPRVMLVFWLIAGISFGLCKISENE